MYQDTHFVTRSTDFARVCQDDTSMAKLEVVILKWVGNFWTVATSPIGLNQKSLKLHLNIFVKIATTISCNKIASQVELDQLERIRASYPN
jgi:hypothetical protein